MHGLTVTALSTRSGSEYESGAVRLSVRHERIHLGRTLPEDLPNRFAGRLTDVVFGGSTVRYVVALESVREPVEIYAVQAYGGHPAGVGLGDPVQVGWSADATIVLPGA